MTARKKSSTQGRCTATKSSAVDSSTGDGSCDERRDIASEDVAPVTDHTGKRRSTVRPGATSDLPRATTMAANDGRTTVSTERRQHTALVEPTLQLIDAVIAGAQARSRLVQKLMNDGTYRGMKVLTSFGLVVIETSRGRRVVLSPELWAMAFKEGPDSVWADHLRVPHTFARISQVYWWPDLQHEVKRWVLGCQECGSRKAKPREVVPPLCSLRGGDVGDR